MTLRKLILVLPGGIRRRVTLDDENPDFAPLFGREGVPVPAGERKPPPAGKDAAQKAWTRH